MALAVVLLLLPLLLLLPRAAATSWRTDSQCWALESRCAVVLREVATRRSSAYAGGTGEGGPTIPAMAVAQAAEAAAGSTLARGTEEGGPKSLAKLRSAASTNTAMGNRNLELSSCSDNRADQQLRTRFLSSKSACSQPHALRRVRGCAILHSVSWCALLAAWVSGVNADIMRTSSSDATLAGSGPNCKVLPLLECERGEAGLQLSSAAPRAT